jgi:hypothetical protein
MFSLKLTLRGKVFDAVCTNIDSGIAKDARSARPLFESLRSLLRRSRKLSGLLQQRSCSPGIPIKPMTLV